MFPFDDVIMTILPVEIGEVMYNIMKQVIIYNTRIWSAACDSQKKIPR